MKFKKKPAGVPPVVIGPRGFHKAYYTDDVASSKFGTFVKLLARWRSSIYKVIWKYLAIFLVLYYTISLCYRFVMTDHQRSKFEGICHYFHGLMVDIPLAFVLGFYLEAIINRYYYCFWNIPWPTRTAVLLTAYLRGTDERGHLLRHTIMRYMIISYIMTMRSVSPPVRRRFPTLDHITKDGIMTADEQHILEHVKTQHNKYAVPLVWATTLVMKAHSEGRIQSDLAVGIIYEKINSFRQGLLNLFLIDSVGIPLVYTQVYWLKCLKTVTLAVYMRFIFALFGDQFIEGGHDADLYIPFKTIIEFVFYCGLLKVAATLINPLGDDDDDFGTSGFVDRISKLSYMIVDEVHQQYPALLQANISRQHLMAASRVSYGKLPTSVALTNSPDTADRLEGESTVLRFLKSDAGFVNFSLPTVNEVDVDDQEENSVLMIAEAPSVAPSVVPSVHTTVENEQRQTVHSDLRSSRSRHDSVGTSMLRDMSPQFVAKHHPRHSAFYNRFEEVSSIHPDNKKTKDNAASTDVIDIPNPVPAAAPATSRLSRFMSSLTHHFKKS